MKSISRYIQAFSCLLTILSSLVILNLISLFMMKQMREKAGEEKISETYFFSGYELCNL